MLCLISQCHRFYLNLSREHRVHPVRPANLVQVFPGTRKPGIVHCFRAVQLVLDVIWSSLIWPSCSQIQPVVCTLSQTLCISVSNLMIRDFDNDKGTSSRVFLTRLHGVKGFS